MAIVSHKINLCNSSCSGDSLQFYGHLSCSSDIRISLSVISHSDDWPMQCSDSDGSQLPSVVQEDVIIRMVISLLGSVSSSLDFHHRS